MIALIITWEFHMDYCIVVAINNFALYKLSVLDIDFRIIRIV